MTRPITRGGPRCQRLAIALALLALASCSGFRKQRAGQLQDCERNCAPYPVAFWGAVGSSEACLCGGAQPSR